MVGSFRKDQIITFLLEEHDFGMEGDFSNFDVPTILHNDGYVGKNCLTIIHKRNGRKIRSKIYDKMVQMLESFSVRSNGGSHWRDWATQQNTTLAKARDSPGARDCGLTRFEITFYGVEGLDREQIEEEMDWLKSLFPKEVVLSTPYTAKWTTLASYFQHTLVLHDVERDTAYFAYVYNEVTDKNAYVVAKNFNKDKEWLLGDLSLKSHLPIQFVEFTITEGNYSIHTKSSTIVKVWNGEYGGESTRLIAKNAFARNKTKSKANAQLLTNAGFASCLTVTLDLKEGTKKAVQYDFYTLEPTPIVVEEETEALCYLEILEQKTTLEMLKCIREERLEKMRKQELEWQKQETHRKWLEKTRSSLLASADAIKSVQIGTYGIVGYKLVNTRFGLKYVIVLETNDKQKTVWTSRKLNSELEEVISKNKLPTKWHIGSELKISITGFGECNGFPFPYYNLQVLDQEPVVFEPEPETVEELYSSNLVFRKELVKNLFKNLLKNLTRTLVLFVFLLSKVNFLDAK